MQNAQVTLFALRTRWAAYDHKSCGMEFSPDGSCLMRSTRPRSGSPASGLWQLLPQFSLDSKSASIVVAGVKRGRSVEMMALLHSPVN